MCLTNGQCPVCKKDAKYLPINGDDDRFYYCPQCGDYYIPGNCARYLEGVVEYPDMVESMRTRPGLKIRSLVFRQIFRVQPL